jgi:hypothetical protein
MQLSKPSGEGPDVLIGVPAAPEYLPTSRLT